MNIFIVIIVVIIAGIVLINGKNFFKSKPREDSLKDIEQFLDQKFVLLEDNSHSVQVSFIFQGRTYTYEDVEQKGFAEVNYKGYLKTTLSQPFTFYFTERRKTTTVRSDIRMASEMDLPTIQNKQEIPLPKSLSSLCLYSNDPKKALNLIDDPKVLQILGGYKNTDQRGYHFHSLKFLNGVLILEFKPSIQFQPNLKNLYSNPSSLVTHAENLDTLAKRIEMKDE